jgi:hypothetical protein
MHVLQIPSGFAPKENTFDVDKRVKTLPLRFSGVKREREREREREIEREREKEKREERGCAPLHVFAKSLSPPPSPPNTHTLVRSLACYSLMHMCWFCVRVGTHKEITCFPGSVMFVHIIYTDSTHTCVRMLYKFVHS